MSDRRSSGAVALVTGAAGFVGANLVRRLAGEGAVVYATARPGGDRWRLAGLDADVRELDITERKAVDALFAATGVNWVFHLAAHGAYSWQTDTSHAMQTNVLGTVNLVDSALAHGVDAFVHAGSSSEYGFKDSAPTEAALLEPATAYAVGKAAATLYCRARSLAEDHHLCSLRLYSAYGPWEEPKRLVPTLLGRAMGGGLPPLVDPETARDFVYVEDVCDALLAAAMRTDLPRGSIFNVGSGRQTTIREIVEQVRGQFELGIEPKWGSHEARVWDTSCWVADPSAANRLLEWEARTSLSEGLQRTAAWLRDEGRDTGRYEISAPCD